MELGRVFVALLSWAAWQLDRRGLEEGDSDKSVCGWTRGAASVVVCLGGAVLVVSGGSIDGEGGQRRLGMKRFESSRINNSGDERQWTSPGGRSVSVCIGLKQPFAGQAEGGL